MDIKYNQSRFNLRDRLIPQDEKNDIYEIINDDNSIYIGTKAKIIEKGEKDDVLTTAIELIDYDGLFSHSCSEMVASGEGRWVRFKDLRKIS
jgi:hypothetical protein